MQFFFLPCLVFFFFFFLVSASATFREIDQSCTVDRVNTWSIMRRYVDDVRTVRVCAYLGMHEGFPRRQPMHMYRIWKSHRCGFMVERASERATSRTEGKGRGWVGLG
ncbi:uncharacterized protein GGS25DRAFT_508373 [Hypoxylon fragiforme]|uniref:uncharacterized protein n=1 Tax=Hypoxylon fragiforme TaxID=63214 RepID=UPI0020C67D2B|nr:uncharacterized protein GGS25DRAFT_508373 [Hypoxylon fragiforme]KAI2604477.1 hypothetical protein GGS25DRAFT_508373 [Hypoxylon fragiforme]